MPRRCSAPAIAPDPYARPLAHDEHVAAARRWESLLDHGLIGRRVATPPAVHANLLATDALFRSFRRGRA